MKLQTLIFCVTLLAACSSPARRPITEEIPLDEMNGLLKENPEYEAVVLMAERFRNGASTPELARANDLSYQQLYAFYKSYTDPELRNRLTLEAQQEWQERFGAAYDRADSVIGHWQNVLDQSKPDSYLKVELRGIDAAESTYGSAQVSILVTPLKGALDKVEGQFGLFLREKPHGFGDFSISRHNTFAFEHGLSKATTCNTGMTYSIWDITDGDIPYNMYPDRAGLPLKELLTKYCFDYTVTTLVKDGRTIRLIDVLESIPLSVRNYWTEQDKEQEEVYRRGNVVRELIDPAFCDREEYIRNYDEQYFRDKDSLAAWVLLDRI